MALNSLTVGAKEKTLLSHNGPSQRQTSGADPPMKELCHSRHGV